MCLAGAASAGEPLIPSCRPKALAAEAAPASARVPASAGQGQGGGDATQWWGGGFSAIGLGCLACARPQRAPVPLVSGIALIAFPYLVSNAWAMVLVGAVLVALPWVVRI